MKKETRKRITHILKNYDALIDFAIRIISGNDVCNMLLFDCMPDTFDDTDLDVTARLLAFYITCTDEQREEFKDNAKGDRRLKRIAVAGDKIMNILGIGNPGGDKED